MMNIIVEAYVMAERAIGLVAGQTKAKVCLSDCEFCREVIVQVPLRFCGGKTTKDNCRVRTNCSLQKDPVHPPQGEITPDACPIMLRQQRIKATKKQAA